MIDKPSLQLHCPTHTQQSNMAFSLGGNENATYYRNEANKYPDIRIFTVGQKTSSRTPLMDLQTIGKSRHPCNRCSSDRSPKSDCGN